MPTNTRHMLPAEIMYMTRLGNRVMIKAMAVAFMKDQHPLARLMRDLA